MKIDVSKLTGRHRLVVRNFRNRSPKPFEIGLQERGGGLVADTEWWVRHPSGRIGAAFNQDHQGFVFEVLEVIEPSREEVHANPEDAARRRVNTSGSERSRHPVRIEALEQLLALPAGSILLSDKPCAMFGNYLVEYHGEADGEHLISLGGFVIHQEEVSDYLPATRLIPSEATDEMVARTAAGIGERMRWKSAHWGDLDESAYPHIARAALAAALGGAW